MEAAVLPTLRELGIGFVPFSPLGRGFLTGAFHSAAQFAAGDLRRSIPRMFEHAAANAGIVEAVKTVAARRASTPAQVVLAGVLAQGKISADCGNQAPQVARRKPGRPGGEAGARGSRRDRRPGVDRQRRTLCPLDRSVQREIEPRAGPLPI